MSINLWVFGLIFILLIALFFYLVLRIIWAVLRGIGALLGLGNRRRQGHGFGAGRIAVDAPTAWRVGGKICPNPRCRRPNVADAHYCAQCGQRL